MLVILILIVQIIFKFDIEAKKWTTPEAKGIKICQNEKTKFELTLNVVLYFKLKTVHPNFNKALKKLH